MARRNDMTLSTQRQQATRDRPAVRAALLDEPSRPPEEPPPLVSPADGAGEVDLFHPGRPPHNDPLADFTSGPPPPLSLAPEGGEPIDAATFYRDIVLDCAEVTAHLARLRYEGPRSAVRDEEQRILARSDAILAAGPGSGAALAAWWGDGAQDPYRTWAAVFVLAGMEGAAARRLLVEGLGQLDEGATAAAIFAAEALALLPRQDAGTLDSELASSGHPALAAIALDGRARRGELGQEGLLTALSSDESIVIEMALRAGERAAIDPSVWKTQVGALLEHPRPAVARRAARLLSLWGDAGPLMMVREGGALADKLGPFALELFVLRGTLDDLPRMDSLLGRSEITPDALSAVGRFGHPRALSFLSHFLPDEALGDAAASALETMFGPRVPRKERRRPSAWRDAVAALRPDAGTRLRRGEPWRPAVVAEELRQGGLSRPGATARLDELKSRAGIAARVDLGAWAPDVEAQLSGVLAMLRSG